MFARTHKLLTTKKVRAFEAYYEDFSIYPVGTSETLVRGAAATFEVAFTFGADVPPGVPVTITTGDRGYLERHLKLNLTRLSSHMLKHKVSEDVMPDIFYVSRFREKTILPKLATSAREDDRECIDEMNTENVNKNSELLEKIKRKVLEIIPDATECTDTPLLQLGADSLTLAEICSSINSLVYINLSVIDLFELKTVRAIIEFVVENLVSSTTARGSFLQ